MTSGMVGTSLSRLDRGLKVHLQAHDPGPVQPGRLACICTATCPTSDWVQDMLEAHIVWALANSYWTVCTGNHSVNEAPRAGRARKPPGQHNSNTLRHHLEQGRLAGCFDRICNTHLVQRIAQAGDREPDAQVLQCGLTTREAQVTSAGVRDTS